MKYRTFGKTGCSVSVLGFGTMRMPTADGQEMSSAPDEEACVRLIRGAIDRGVNYIDTARGYTVSEEFLGQALQAFMKSSNDF